MSSQKFWNVATWMFWAFYVIFLLSSIPHLAEWFRHLDGNMSGIADIFYWLLAYAKAVAADGTDVLLTLAFLRMISSADKTGIDYFKIGMVVLFIIGFTGFSWYINWQYEMQFVTSEFARADVETTFFGMEVGATNPAVGSAFQLFVLIFTFISDTIMKKSDYVAPIKDLATLRQEAEDANERATLERQIREARRTAKATIIERLTLTAVEAKRGVKRVVSDGNEAIVEEDALNNETEVATEEEDSVTEILPECEEENVSEVEELVEDAMVTEPEMESLNVTDFPDQIKKSEDKTTGPLNSIDITSRRKPLTTSEAIQVLGVSDKTIREWKKRGTLEEAPDGRSLTVRSVRKVLESRREKVS